MLDIVFAVEFDHSGSYLAIAGSDVRLVFFQKTPLASAVWFTGFDVYSLMKTFHLIRRGKNMPAVSPFPILYWTSNSCPLSQVLGRVLFFLNLHF
eukprot:TRINITY_DN28174_c0_g1_i1.p1 TRINITY_DN28174_c0_g1~~TRINITY_DN28174_c0_g1_i1.p1  ORF type:complete len:104 (+),score=14.42 TRINITY_DN28174_c0_g1_i1:28-312(+)